MAFKVVATFVVFGLSIAAIGGWWMLFDQGIVQEIEVDYWVSNDYLDIMRIVWHGLPAILFVLGIIVAVAAVISSKREVYG